MRIPIVRSLFVFELALVWLTPTAPVLAQASLRDNALSYSDEDFVTQLYQEVIAGERLASMALNLGQKGAVRSLAGNTVASLRQVREAIKVLAGKKGVTISEELIAQNQDAVDRLSSSAGDGFDRTYLDTLLQFLPRILQRCESVTDSTQDADLKALTAGLVPTLKARIEAVQAVKADL
jgi:predicted outer membrane protein